MKSKTYAVWLTLLGGPLGFHRWYLLNKSDHWAVVLPIFSLLGVYGIYRARTLGLDDPASGWLMLLLGVTWAGCALNAIVYGLWDAHKWNTRFNPSASCDASAGTTGWFTVIGIVAALGLGATLLMATLAFGFQRYFELQQETRQEHLSTRLPTLAAHQYNIRLTQ